MPTRDGKLGVGITGIGWCAAQHLSAFQRNPRTEVTWLHGRDAIRVRSNLEKYRTAAPGARITTRYEDLLDAADVDIISIATPNHLHAQQAVAAARAGKHILLEKPTALDREELIAIRDAVRAAGVRTIVSFELRFNPFLKCARWLREAGWLGDLRFARTQYLSRVTDWYAGWSWVRTRESGRSHLLAAGCHAVDALRWCGGAEPVEVSAFHARFTAGYEWPTSIVVNARLATGALGHVTSSTDFMLPYTFLVELMGDRATLRQDLLESLDAPIDVDALQAGNPFPDVSFEPESRASGQQAVRIRCTMPDSADVAHHPFQAEIDELAAAILEGRPSAIDVFDAQRTMEVCLAADSSAEQGGRPVRLPLISGG
ncbi:MAG TPA: Gfo/Idh/MocA family oxidoreductase [Vicinamibacterales bacterium]|nr:Gfo/Idh/MocA family oxidoreductase [Vicinamibacterales bacterium]